MPAFGIAQVRSVTIGPDIARYLQRIDSTLAPFGGRFLAHGAEAEVLEGNWEGAVVILEFPDLEHARAWYNSPGYQEILPLRTQNGDTTVILVDGVPPGYKATDLLEKMR
ncbi:DUF1330 domain-containing protein [Mycobacterium sp. Dal123C01]|uniref:DUF1330 domain-containing protein n=1 Tax=Mycobacterium sp. Dal123C01 TaxID=3457577 RepID=UPI00403E63AB